MQSRDQLTDCRCFQLRAYYSYITDLPQVRRYWVSTSNSSVLNLFTDSRYCNAKHPVLFLIVRALLSIIIVWRPVEQFFKVHVHDSFEFNKYPNSRLDSFSLDSFSFSSLVHFFS